MKIAWHEPVRSWALKPEGHLDESLVKRLTVRRWDPIQRVYWAPEIVWDEIAKWSWPAGSSPTSRYAGSGGAATGREGIILPFPPLDPLAPVYEPMPHQWAGIQGMIDGHFLCGDDMGLGKEQPLTARIMSPSGWKEMGSMKVGDPVIGADGRRYNVTGVFPQGVKPVYRVTFSDGSATECGMDHLWAVNTPVRNRRKNPHLIMTLRELLERGLYEKNGQRKWFIPMLARPADLGGEPVPMDAYTLGAILGNGGLTTNSIRFSSGNEELVGMLKPVEGSCLRHSGGIEYTITSGSRAKRNPTTQVLRRMGLMGCGAARKFVPDEYKWTTSENRLALLQGLFDCDAYAMPGTSTVEYTTASEVLMADVQFVIESLGGCCRIGKSKIVNGKTYYRATVSLPIGMSPFRTKEKLRHHTPRSKYPPSRAIAKVEFIDEQECQCISVSAPDRLYCTDQFIVTHNTAMALWAYEHLRFSGVAVGLVVVCTKRKVADWTEDFERFLYRKPMPQELYVLNYDRTYRGEHSEPVLSALRTRPMVMVTDECHHLGSEMTSRYGACMALGRTAVRRWGLSGTPVRNRPESFHPVYRWVTGAQVERKDFLKKYCHMEGQRITGYRAMALKHLHPIFRTFGIARTKEEVLTLPPARLVPVRVPLRGRQKALYNEMRLSLRATIKTATGDQVVSARGQMFVQLTRLLQIASSPRLIGEDCPDGDLAKLEVLDELVAESGDQKILIWDSHPQTLEELAGRYPGHSPVVLHGGRTVKANEDAKKRFQTDGTCRMACISLLAFGEGVNLQAATVAIFHSLVWNYEKIIQAMARIHRIGQEKPCSMFFLLGRDTLEEHVFGTLETKHGMATSIIRGKAEGWAWDWNQIDRDLLLRLLAKAA